MGSVTSRSVVDVAAAAVGIVVVVVVVVQVSYGAASRHGQNPK